MLSAIAPELEEFEALYNEMMNHEPKNCNQNKITPEISPSASAIQKICEDTMKGLAKCVDSVTEVLEIAIIRSDQEAIAEKHLLREAAIRITKNEINHRLDEILLFYLNQ